MTFRPHLLLLLLAFVATAQAAPVKDPDPVLKDLYARQQALFAEAEKEDPNFDMDGFRTNMQQLVNEYDLLIKDHANYAPAFVAYGLLLGRIDMRKEGATMLLRANQLDGSIPIVKNQLGNYLAEEGKPLEAANYFLSAIELAPKEPLYHYQLGTLLTEARDDFLQSGQWTRDSVEKAMHAAFRQAMELAPGSVAYAYRYGESFYDLESPDWDQALDFWRSLELKVSAGVEKQTLRLHQANILIKDEEPEAARALLETVTEEALQKQKQTLLEQLPPPSDS